MTSLKATLAFGVPLGDGATRSAAATGTMVGYARVDPAGGPPHVDLADTLDASSLSPDSTVLRDSRLTRSDARTTVLPRRTRDAAGLPRPTLEEHPRFDRLRLLGEGGVGTVELARDNDIRRTVAVKKLRSEIKSDGALLRFADEVRIVGQLEHPNIVPIYDVGRDEAGDVYLVMKHLDGETMEDVIEKLRAGDPDYARRFSFEFRAYLYLSVLDAVRYAHSRGVLHRDLKPANIMIGRFDEVTVMDWGIAKPIGARDPQSAGADAHPSWLDSANQRLLETQVGTLAGTPFYMSPEQAAGQNDTLDERTDVYSLAMMFYEWLTLEHPLDGKSNLMEVLAAIITKDYSRSELLGRSGELGVPCEYVYLVERGLVRDREARLPSVDAMYDELKAIMSGEVRVQCPVTFTKRATHETLRFIDKHPRLYVGVFVASSLLVIAGLVGLVWMAAAAIR